MRTLWSMQLHPNNMGEFPVDRIKSILHNRRMVGVGGDNVDAQRFESEAQIGDVALIRNGSTLIALVQFTSEAHSNPEPDDDCWFDVVRDVKIIAMDPEAFFDEFRFTYGKDPTDGLRVRGTFYRIANDNVATFASFWEEKARGEEMINEMINLLTRAKQIVLTGAPGTGKTFLARQIAMQMILGKSEANESKLSEAEKKKIVEQMELVQFHPSFDYTDFVEGLRPIKSEDGNSLGFERQDGLFKAFCKKAIATDSDLKPYVFIIDEINRGDISKIFGELFFAIDKGYRGKTGVRVKTQYKNLIDREDPFYRGFYVPENVYIIGTMNDIDRNVESMDFAIRRRFTWKEITPRMRFDAMWSDISEVSEEIKEKARMRMDRINAVISDTSGLGPAFQIGPAYFRELVSYREEADSGFQLLWEYHIGPLVREYLRGFPNSEVIIAKIKDAYDNRTDKGDDGTEAELEEE